MLSEKLAQVGDEILRAIHLREVSATRVFLTIRQTIFGARKDNKYCTSVIYNISKRYKLGFWSSADFVRLK